VLFHTILFHTRGSQTRAATHHTPRAAARSTPIFPRGTPQNSAQVPLVFSFSYHSVTCDAGFCCCAENIFLRIQLSSIDVIEGFVDTRTEGFVSLPREKKHAVDKNIPSALKKY
jgi:hypothetical protein